MAFSPSLRDPCGDQHIQNTLERICVELQPGREIRTAGGILLHHRQKQSRFDRRRRGRSKSPQVATIELPY